MTHEERFLQPSRPPQSGTSSEQSQHDEATWATTRAENVTFTSSAILDGRIWLEQTPWRIASGWSMLAALLGTGVIENLHLIDLPRLLLLYVLVDLLWGGIWGAMALPNSLPNLTDSMHRTRIWLPYLHAGSPAARLFGTDSPGILPLVSRVALPGIALAMLIAATLDPLLFWLTVAIVIVGIGGWLYRQVPLVPIFVLHSFVAVAFPWGAVHLFLDGTDAVEMRYPIALAILWTIHTWGGNRSIAKRGDRVGLVGIALSQAGISILLILVQAPLWLALLAVLWLPTWLAVYRERSLHLVEFWWLAAMIVSSIAIGQGT